MSARIEASRKRSLSARAMSRTMASVFSRCGAAPAEPAVPIRRCRAGARHAEAGSGRLGSWPAPGVPTN
jgi:hypothetical protein